MTKTEKPFMPTITSLPLLDYSKSPYALTESQLDAIVKTALIAVTPPKPMIIHQDVSSFLREGSYLFRNVFPDFVKRILEPPE